jgi:hypothetical protein
MSKISDITAELRDTVQSLARLEKGSVNLTTSRSFLLNQQALQKRQTSLEEQLEHLASQQQTDVVNYRLFSDSDDSMSITAVAKTLTDFQEWLTTIYDALKNGPKERDRRDAEVVSTTRLNFAYSYAGSVGVVMTMPAEQLLIGETNLDKAVETIFKLVKAKSTEEIATYAKSLGPATIRRMYRWVTDHLESGVGADIEWRRNQSVKSSLLIQQQELRELQATIGATSEETETTIEIPGVLIGADIDRRTFHLRIEGDEDVSGTMSPLIGTKVTLELGKRYTATILRKTKTIYVTEKDEITNFLLKIV